MSLKRRIESIEVEAGRFLTGHIDPQAPHRGSVPASRRAIVRLYVLSCKDDTTPLSLTHPSTDPVEEQVRR
jgi:hypothetical protein